MRIGIIVAMDSEKQQLLPLIDGLQTTLVNDYEIVTGRIGANDVAVMLTGIGKVNAAVGAVSLIDTFRPDVIVNTGIAGGTGHGAGVLDVVIADAVGYHDVYCGPGNARGQVQGYPVTFACEGTNLLNLPAAIASVERHASEAEGESHNATAPRVVRGLIASGDLFVSTPEELRAVLEVQPQAVAVDMESGAIAQVCCMKNVPFAAVRVVSDTPGIENHHEQYSSFFSIAPRTTFSILRALMS